MITSHKKHLDLSMTLNDWIALMTQPQATPITIAQAITDFYIAKRAERLSPNTIKEYTITLTRFEKHTGSEKLITDITPGDIRSFLAGLDHLSKKTVLNAHVALSSLWTWAVRDGYCVEHVVHQVKPPKPEERIIQPFTQDEIRRILAEAVKRDSVRNRAIVLFLLDTGVRASELCALTIGDIQGAGVKIFGKGSKEREVPMSPRLLRALLDYLAGRRNTTRKSPLFALRDGSFMNRGSLLKWFSRIGDRIGIEDVHPHRFRHTFAVNYLKNGGDAISLQRLLGHSTLDMVKRYVQLASEDVAIIHRRASPIEKWEL
jgi:integrase/recombinase XerD